ncbi:unnamed protein product [Rhizophagus irregularis]|nr:unnamed protein product [Rhizophagus irregularis]
MSKSTPKAIREKLDQILGSQYDNNKFIDFCSLALEAKVNTNFSKDNHSRQDKHLSKKNNLPISQEGQTVVLDDIFFELDSIQSENSVNENFILLKYYRMGKKAQDQMCLLISNNWWYS